MARAQDRIVLHFVYGSRPRASHRATEPKWFGGLMGGHVGLGWAQDSILNFLPSGKFHILGQRSPKHSHFVVTSDERFAHLLGGSSGQIQRLRICIPVDSAQAQTFEAIRTRYLDATPYDYAFLGMRCASSSQEILAKLGITRRQGYWGTIFGTFHPRVLRKRMQRMALRNAWPMQFAPGGTERRWQR